MPRPSSGHPYPVFRRWLAAAIVLIAAIGVARAQAVDLTPAQDAIYRTAVDPGGYLTRSMHRKFWDALPGEIRTDPTIRDPFLARLETSLATGMHYQHALWQSAALSHDAKKVVTVPGYEAAKSDAAMVALRSGSDTSDSEAMLALGDRLLMAAATGEMLIMPDGANRLTKETITSTVSRLDAAMARLTLLLAPDWQPQTVAYREERSGLTFSTTVPFSRDEILRASRSGRGSGNCHPQPPG